VHTENWKAYRGSLASTVALAPTTLEADQKQNVTGKIARAEDQAATSKTGTQNIVKLSAGVKEVANPSKELEAKLTMLQEENTAQAKSLKEAQERTANLEKQIADMRQLLALNSQVMAELQKNTAANIAKPAVQLNTSLPPSDVTQVASTSTSDAVVVMTPIPAKHAELARVLMKIMFGIVDWSVFIATFGVAFLLGVLWFIRNKRKKALEKLEVNALNLDGMRNKAVFGNTTHRNNATDTAFLKYFAQSDGVSFMDTPDVDPIAEAEVDMAYGRYEQAEATLKNAISKSPKHYELHLKLLELYRAHQDMVAFESFAHTLFAELGADSPIWAKVVEIGSAIDPTNALYQAVTISTTKSKASSVKVSEEASIQSQQVGDQSKDVLMAQVGQSAGHPDVADISNAMESVSLDFELDSAKKSSTKPAPTLSEVLQDQGIQRNAKGFDFSSISFDLDEADTKPAVAKPMIDIATQAVSAADDSQALDLKLDLVSAYIDMGDTEGARVLLDEVKKIGNKHQKLRAKKLLAKLV
jgi:pilus assembly protein FimV